ncbi:hypothetical protein OsI_11808 [Oryza sativa Indica Group]|uniref:Small ribosomal subunit protein uS4 N-terminal domain-containing protein n=1 Tax=Oryza sativa subsp. indica TaxID=39946 RepID=B8AQJ1_ORYSI|nr:hypothetical protein OsI_11808 [Oryza sativa Indica Group]
MVRVSFYRNYGKTFKKPRRPYEKERPDAELKLYGEYGLRELLTLDEKNPRRIFEGEALLRHMNRYGLLGEGQNKLDYVFALTVENFLQCRLQTIVFKNGTVKSIHHDHVLIRQHHISPLAVSLEGSKRKNQKEASGGDGDGDGDEEEE